MAFALHFGLLGSHFDPPWLHFEALLGSLGALPITCASTHILSQRCSEAHADKTMYDMIKPRPGGVRGSVLNIYIYIYIYICKFSQGFVNFGKTCIKFPNVCQKLKANVDIYTEYVGPRVNPIWKT